MSAEVSSPVVIIGVACRVPGADDIDSFADMLFEARTGYGELPPDRCDRELYLDSRKGVTGKSYSTLGGTVPERTLNPELCRRFQTLKGLRDVTHIQFADVAATAWRHAGLVADDRRFRRTGVYVGHSGGTQSGGGLSLGTQIEEALSFANDIPEFQRLPYDIRRAVLAEVAASIRRVRPSRHPDALPCFNAYQAAALAAQTLGLQGPRSVIDAACASSLVALAQSMLAIRNGRIDSAVVGGATYNNIDNLILFSHSQACTAKDSRPFDDFASGLVSSEGYVAIVVTTLDRAIEYELPILAVIRGVGMSSDGKGRSLWAPRTEGQVLALQRAYRDIPLLDIDYLEAHATSTQLGDATELETLRTLASQSTSFAEGGGRTGTGRQLLLGSVKSNIGHTLEAAGLIGLVKVLLAMQRGRIPASLRFEQPNRQFEWGTAPLRVVTQSESWPDTRGLRRPRRAAVSAFGIGGLNAHVVFDEAGSDKADYGRDVSRSPQGSERGQSGLRPDERSRPHEPIAVIGRGIVVAGAKNLAEFADLMHSGRTAIIDAPPERWRERAGVAFHDQPQTYRSPHCRGGFVTDFTFDGARYRIPPKQVEQANPLQMMLIDAVAQALQDVEAYRADEPASVDRRVAADFDAGYSLQNSDQWPFDRQRVGVIIGTIFGGEFGDSLQVGMRLPEICQRLEESLSRRGVNRSNCEQLSQELQSVILRHRAALLDETGSFTASTLASRVAKTFDLMGGACALDSDDVSGLAALMAAVDQLQSGSSDMVVCGSAQRSMSLAAFEWLDMNGRLTRSGRSEDVEDDCRTILPGEGVVVLMLCRHADAVRLKLPIHGILGDVVQVSDIQQSATSRTCHDRSDAEIVRKIGYLSGAHSLVRIAAETICPEDKKTPVLIAARSSDGIVLQARLTITAAHHERPLKVVPPLPGFVSPSAPARSSVDRHTSKQTPLPVTPVHMPVPTATDASGRTLRGFRFAAESGSSLRQLFSMVVSDVDHLFENGHEGVCRSHRSGRNSGGGFDANDQFRGFIVSGTPDQLRERLAVALKAAEAGKFRTLIDRDRVVLWQAHSLPPRTAWLFPGQGAHYSTVPSVFEFSDAAQQILRSIDGQYAAAGLPPLSAALGNVDIRPGEDIWWAQAWVLGVTAGLISSLKAERLSPDAVLGHSFGEFTASLAVGVTTMSETVELARHRANAVISHMRTPGGLLSVRGPVHEIDAILKSSSLPVYITHLNSPLQTVIAGSREGIAAAKTLLDRRNLAAVQISVPAPFHTPLLADAQTAFERMSAGVQMRPPICGFLSATSVQYLAEPSDIRQSLVRQLTQPVMYMPSIRRMVSDGFQVFLEVGPNDVLTRLNRDIAGDQALCLSLDVPGQRFDERMQLVRGVLECVTGTATTGSDSLRRETSSSPAGMKGLDNRVSGLIIDVTSARRGSRKNGSGSSSDATSAVLPVNRPAGDLLEEPAVADRVEFSSAESGSASTLHLRAFVHDLVIELTGYPAEVVTFEADLEADLGIDSIKKAQILGEIGAWLGLTLNPEGIRMDLVRTLNDAVRLATELFESAAGSLPKGNNVRTAGSVTSDSLRGDSSGYIVSGTMPRIESLPHVAAAPRYESVRTTAGVAGRLPPTDQLDSLLIDYVVDQTGYPRGIVDIDADLEADLGLDSIKLAQLIGEMREQFQLHAVTLESIAQTRFRTLRGIRDFLITHVADTQPAGSVSEDRADWVRAAVPAEVVEAPQQFSIVRGIDVNSNTDRGLQDWSDVKTDHNGQMADAFTAGRDFGETYRTEVRASLRELVYQPEALVADSLNWSDDQVARLSGIAAGAGVTSAAVRAAAGFIKSRTISVGEQALTGGRKGRDEFEGPSVSDETDVRRTARNVPEPGARKAASPENTHRYALRVVAAPRRAGMPKQPILQGAALILGKNSTAEALAERIRSTGQRAVVVDTAEPVHNIETELSALWNHTPTPHLFLSMAFDEHSAGTGRLSVQSWANRRPAALEVPFRVCQLWMQKTIELGRMEDASVVAVTRLGGDFGFSGQHVQSIEAIGGLVKAMLIESWMRGYRTTPMKVVDVEPGMPSDEIADGVMQELAVPSYDMEIALRSARGIQGPERYSVQAVPAPLGASRTSSGSSAHSQITRGGTWIVSGGGRGITAVIAMTLAARYELILHLLGTAPVPELSEEIVRQAAADRSGFRRSIMQQAVERGENPVEAWRNMEKSLEIDATLTQCRERNIKAVYHSCDVSDFSAVDRILGEIRRNAGAIRGVIHGAGFGQDSRFDRKRPDKVDQCLRSKIDGCLALMAATNADPLEWFAAFGSISGRFGANGHTDYSLANDMMAKIVDRYRRQRSSVRSVTFHWHAWGDIGMATKPEARLALEMIDMEFMPATEGIAHFIREIEFGGNEPEVLITDESYFRKFFPADRVSSTSAADTLSVQYPLIPSSVTEQHDGGWSSVVTLNPTNDRFLSQHRVNGRPTLPFVVVLEMMAEAVRLRTSWSGSLICVQARALHAVRFSGDDPLAVTIQTRSGRDGAVECRLLADVRRRDGRLVQEDREFFSALFESSNGATESHGQDQPFTVPSHLSWKRIKYAAEDSIVYHGPELQELRQLAESDGVIYGRIAASAPVQLFGGSRARGFTVPCSTMDACLYAVGYAAWQRYRKPSLPVQFDRIEFGRMPDPGEPCLLRILEKDVTDTGAAWDFLLQGHNGDRLLTVTGYRTGWLRAGS